MATNIGAACISAAAADPASSGLERKAMRSKKRVKDRLALCEKVSRVHGRKRVAG